VHLTGSVGPFLSGLTDKRWGRKGREKREQVEGGLVGAVDRDLGQVREIGKKWGELERRGVIMRGEKETGAHSKGG